MLQAVPVPGDPLLSLLVSSQCLLERLLLLISDLPVQIPLISFRPANLKKKSDIPDECSIFRVLKKTYLAATMNAS